MKLPISVYLVEDHIVVRNGLKGLIESMGEYKVTAEYDNGKELIAAIPGANPDVIIMDLTMPVMGGHETMKWMKEHAIDLPVLVLTLDTTDKTIIDLYKLGVRGYLPKTCNADTLKKAIDDIVRTGYYHNELLSNALMRDDTRPKRDGRQSIISQFAGREMEFLLLVCDKEEYTYEQIADKMKVHRRTVDGYRESLFDKFNIKSKTGLVLFAIKNNLITV